MSEKNPSIQTPIYDPEKPFAEPHFLTNIVGFTHDPVASMAQGFRADQIWVVCRFVPVEAGYRSDEIEVKEPDYRLARSQYDKAIYRRFPARQFPDLKEGSIWPLKDNQLPKSLDRFRAILDPSKIRYVWNIDEYEDLLWLREDGASLKFLSHMPTPQILINGFVRKHWFVEAERQQVREYEHGEFQTTFQISSADLLRYILDRSSELTIVLLNGATKSPYEMLFRETPYYTDQGALKAKSRYVNDEGKIKAAQVLLGLHSYGKAALRVVARCRTMLLKKYLLDMPWEISPPQIPLPFDKPFGVEFYGNEVELNTEILDPERQQIEWVENEPGIDVVRLTTVIAKRKTTDIQLVLPERKKREPRQASEGIPVIEKSYPNKIHGAVVSPPSPEKKEYLEKLKGNEVYSKPAHADLNFKIVREKNDGDETTGPKYMVTPTESEKASFGEMLQSAGHYVAQNYAPDYEVKNVRSNDEALDEGPVREIFRKCPEPFPEAHIVSLSPVTEGSSSLHLRGSLNGAEISFPLPDLATVLWNMHQNGEANIHTLAHDWLPVHSGSIGMLEFPTDWKKTIGLGTREKSRNLCAIVARIERNNIPRYLFCLERRYVPSEDTYNGRPNFMIKPRTAAGITIRDIFDILYCGVLKDINHSDRNGWPTNAELEKATGIPQRLRIIDASTDTMWETVNSMLEHLG
ncbi:hypothetical protein ACFOY8_21150 [Thalassospira xianhensis]|uniref:Uncharacterized protein n=1 Tax=Thalassospira xianhensis MCCC 1A02616 TaxID=1177929 RepID=A0A367UGQ8_9PROT|nr:hypothetical protein [Thalassospira xianhensis]RCK07180.1 hypothetical protein TH5_04390 [Thalassospira xianhensis MCCC 1A02616]